MKSSVALVTLGGVCAVLTACGGSPPTPQPSATTPRATSTPATSTPATSTPATSSPTSTPATSPPATSAPAPVASLRPDQSGQPARAGQPAPLVPAAPTVAAAEVPKYLDKGRKDPFTEVQLSATTGGLSVATTKLTGIVRGPRSVLALLETQEGIGYILKPGDTLGDGRLMEIGADSVVFAVGPKAGSAAQRVVLRLAAN